MFAVKIVALAIMLLVFSCLYVWKFFGFVTNENIKLFSFAISILMIPAGGASEGGTIFIPFGLLFSILTFTTSSAIIPFHTFIYIFPVMLTIAYVVRLIYKRIGSRGLESIFKMGP